MNTQIKRQIVRLNLKSKTQLCLSTKICSKDRGGENKKRRKDTHGNTHHKETGVALSISEEIDFRKTTTKDKRKNCIVFKGLIQQEDITELTAKMTAWESTLAIPFKSKYALTI